MRSEANGERRFWTLLAVSGVLAVLLIVRPGWSTPVASVVEIDGAIVVSSEALASGPLSDPLLVGSPIDLNTADEASLDEIPGVGATLAASIVAGRSAGNYRDLADLDARVPRLSDAALDSIATFGTFGGPFPPEPPIVRDRPKARAPAAKKQKAKPRKLDPNTATAAQLDGLPGIGPALAARIVADRAANGGYSRAEDLDRVAGIGPAAIEKLRPFVDFH